MTEADQNESRKSSQTCSSSRPRMRRISSRQFNCLSWNCSFPFAQPLCCDRWLLRLLVSKQNQMLPRSECTFAAERNRESQCMNLECMCEARICTMSWRSRVFRRAARVREWGLPGLPAATDLLLDIQKPPGHPAKSRASRAPPV